MPKPECLNCGGALLSDPLAPDGVTHATGDLLCPGHTTVSSDGSNTARAQLAPDPAEGDHEVINVMGDWTFRCPAWGLWWRYLSQEHAEYFLAAHLIYPVAPCVGALRGVVSETRG